MITVLHIFSALTGLFVSILSAVFNKDKKLKLFFVFCAFLLFVTNASIIILNNEIVQKEAKYKKYENIFGVNILGSRQECRGDTLCYESGFESVRMNNSWKLKENGEYEVLCKKNTFSDMQEVIKKQSQYPFSYFVLYMCTKNKEYKSRSIIILKDLISLDGHIPDYEWALNKLILEK